MTKRKLTLLNVGEPPGCRCGGNTLQVFITVPVTNLDAYVNGEIEIDDEARRQLNEMKIDPHYVVIGKIMDNLSACRCGFIGLLEPHPCHGKSYTCRQPAKQHFYVTSDKFALTGIQMKAVASDTWACDECWTEFAKLLTEVRGVK